MSFSGRLSSVIPGKHASFSNTLVIVSTIMGITTILSISISITLFFVKCKKNNQTQYCNVSQNRIPLGQISNAAYDEIGDMDEITPTNENGGEIRTNQELRRNREANQNVLVGNDNPNASNSDQALETQSSSYERIALSQVVERNDPYEQLQNVNEHSEGGNIVHMPAFSKKTGAFKYENIFRKKNYENVDSNQKIIDMNFQVNADNFTHSMDGYNESMHSMRNDEGRESDDYSNKTI